jgi:hypothetical protein
LVTRNYAHKPKRHRTKNFTRFKRGKQPTKSSYKYWLAVIKLKLVIIKVAFCSAINTVCVVKKQACIIKINIAALYTIAYGTPTRCIVGQEAVFILLNMPYAAFRMIIRSRQ